MAYPGPVFPDNRKRGQDYPYSKKTAIQWGGYNHRKAAGDTEWYDTQNMTADYAPILASRGPIWYCGEYAYDKFHGMCGGDKLYIALGTEVRLVDYASPSVSVLQGLEDSDKLMCVFGNRLIVWPDKVAYNTTTQQTESIEMHSSPTQITFFSGTYMDEPATANCIYLEGISAGTFHVNDAVTIDGCYTHTENNLTIVIREVDEYTVTINGSPTACTVLHFYDNSFVIGSGTVTIYKQDGSTGTVDGYTETALVLSIDRTAPDLDILFAHENRLWGAKGDTIYASALGDPFNWNNFDITGLESWTVDVLDEGDFTGGISFMGYPVFFKDTHIYKVYGTVPSDFQIVQSADLGVEPGSGDSLAIAGEKLFYLSRAGVMCYTGALPQIISAPLGDIKYHNAIAGTDGLKYWIVAETGRDYWNMFVYDTQTNIWHRQDLIVTRYGLSTSDRVKGFAWHDKCLYAATEYIDDSTDPPNYTTTVYAIGEEEDQPLVPSVPAENPVQWYLESADFTEYSPQRKWIGPRIEIRAELEVGAQFSVYVRHNNEQAWELVGGPFTDAGKHSFVCAKIPARSDFYKIRIAGTGRVWIYSIAPMTDQGSSDFGYNGG